MAEKEYIERNAAIAKIKDKINEYPHNSNPYWISNDNYIVRGLREAIEIIDEYTPTADVQKVVRCKDCSYFCKATVNKKGFLICSASGMDITDNDFCSYGAKMDKE